MTSPKDKMTAAYLQRMLEAIAERLDKIERAARRRWRHPEEPPDDELDALYELDDDEEED